MMLLLSTILLYTAAVSGHDGHSHGHGPDKKTCGTKDLTPAEVDLDMQRMRKWGRGRSRADGSLETVCVGCVNIGIYFHVFSNGTTPGPDHDPTVNPTTDDLLNDEGIAYQMQVLNQHFVGSPFTFTLLETIRYADASLANADERTQESLVDAIHANRRGGKEVANVYWYAGSCKTECGEASFPNGFGIFPADTYRSGDYIEMCPYCMANGLLDSQSPTLTHEFGHWLGLLHTFAGSSCEASNVGDLVADTPQHLETDSDTCNATQDSCPLLPGFDPIDNYMDYSPDECQEGFTTGQIQRMWAQWNEYRAPVPVCPSDQTSLTVRMRFGNGPLTNASTILLDDNKDDDRHFLVTSQNNALDFSGMEASYGACFSLSAVQEFWVQLVGHSITDSYFAALDIRGNEVYRTTTANGLLYFFEEKVDCGTQGLFVYELDSDGFPGEISWEIKDSDGKVVASNPFSIRWRANFLSMHCLDTGSYTFTISDPDGIDAPGFYRLVSEGQEIVRGGSFSGSETTSFVVIGTQPTSTSPQEPSSSPSVSPTKVPTKGPTVAPIAAPTGVPTRTPTIAPTKRPVPSPTEVPVESPTMIPTRLPVVSPTPVPAPTSPPTSRPVLSPTEAPIRALTTSPVSSPTLVPLRSPTVFPVPSPSVLPTEVDLPGDQEQPTSVPTSRPVRSPTEAPLRAPTNSPISSPIEAPVPTSTSVPLPSRTGLPIATPTSLPIPADQEPSSSPVRVPVSTPTELPTVLPTVVDLPGDQEAPTSFPFRAPVAAPVSVPTRDSPPSPNVNTLLRMICFSNRNKVHVRGVGHVAMDEIKVGDWVEVGKDIYEPVYSFCKHSHSISGKFQQIFAAGLDAPLELSANHLLFLASNNEQEGTAIPASDIQVGDTLVQGDGTAVVTEIRTVERSGIYAPYTASGTIVVNGVLASNYATIDPLLVSHDILHFAQSHHRLLCRTTGLCKYESYEESTGLSSISSVSLKIYKWWTGQFGFVNGLVSMAMLGGLGLAYALDCALQWAMENTGSSVLFHLGCLALISVLLVWARAYRRLHAKKQSLK